jgi:hypothetical protein
MLLSTTSRAWAHGEEIVVYLGGGAVLAQVIEGILIRIAMRERRHSRPWVMGFFVLGVIAAWWFALGSGGLMALIDALETRFNMPNSIETPLYWIVMLSTGPLFAAAAAVCSGRLLSQRGRP